MTCEEFVELVTAYLDDTLPADQRRAFDEHMALCPGCERYLAQFQTTIDLLGDLPQDAISTPARDRLLDAFAEWKHTSDSDGS